jgi:hypothetical protein
VIFSLFLELGYWIIWGLVLFPHHIWKKLRWALNSGLGMGSVVGVITCLLIIGKLREKKAV